LNYKIVFTGFRDPELEREIEDKGGEVTTSVSKKTSLVVCANKDENTSKITKAKELGIKLLTVQEFKNFLKNI
jgi:DNA ligase (NAD+)